MAAESSFLGLDSTAWTALGTLTALAIAVGGIILPWLHRKLQKPSLILDFANASKLSSSLNGVSFWVRIPVTNLKAGTVAENVEVFLVSADSNDPATKESLLTFVPMRLLWSHTQTATCDRIPCATYKLLDVGVLYPLGMPRVTMDGPFWKFAGEVKADNEIVPRSNIRARVILSADEIVSSRIDFELVFGLDQNAHRTVQIRSV